MIGRTAADDVQRSEGKAMKNVKDVILIFSLSLNFGVVLAGTAFYLFGKSSPALMLMGNAAPAPSAAAAPAGSAAPVTVSTEGHPSRGPATAPITLVEFSDFECPFCARATPVLKQLEEAYPGQIRRVFRQFPLMAIHPGAERAAEASLCAAEQERFWEMHDALFEQPVALDPADLHRKAAQVGLDAASFKTCLDMQKYADTIEQDLKEGVAHGVTGTPAVFINGRLVSGARPYAEFAQVIDAELARLQK
jgi:protein-disulfide isomerase